MRVNPVFLAAMVCVTSTMALAASPETAAVSPVAQTATPAAVKDTAIAAATAEDSVVSAVGSIRVVSLPDGAALGVDGQDRGATPVTVGNLSVGEHAIELRKPGHYLKKARITVAADTVTEYSFELLAPAGLRVTSTPAGADVVLDGKSVGTTPASADKLKPGPHQLEVSMSTYTTVKRSVELASGATDTVSIALAHTKEYADSVALAEKPRSGKSLAIRIIVLSVFVLFGAGILVAELAGP
jgi:hypothetical protein